MALHSGTLFSTLLLLSLSSVGDALAADQRVVVYTAHEASITDAMTPLFQKETGIAVDVVKAGSGDILKRVKAEASAPRADVIWSVGGDLLGENASLLEPYKPAEFDKIDPKFRPAATWLPYTGVVMVLAVNTSKLKPDSYPKTWGDLANPRWQGMVSSARADSSASAFIQMATVLEAYGDKGWDLYAKIFANFALSDSSGAVSRFVNDGEALVGLTLEDNALQYVKGGGTVAIVYPNDGTSLTADGIALVKGAPRAESGKKFIDWALSKSTQEVLVQKIGRRSVRTDVAANPALPPLSEIKLVAYDTDRVTLQRAELLAKWKQVSQRR
jgi:iron(III) transport system substrate-binding protein